MDETLKIIEKMLYYNKNAQNFFSVASKVDKGKSEPKQKSNQLIPKWEQVSEEIFNFINLEINENKDLGTAIDNKGYTLIHLNDVNESVNKIAKGKIGKNNASKAYNNLVDKAEQIVAITPPHPDKKY